MKKLICLFLLMPLLTTAQINMDEVDFEDSPELDFFQALDTVFGALDKSKIPSGILLERSLRAVEVEKMDGKHPDYIVIRDSILQLYSEMHIGSFEIDTRESVFTIDSLAKAWQQEHDAIPLLLIHQEYQKFKPNAFEDGLLSIDGMTILDLSGANETPYEDKTAFAAAPFVKSVNEGVINLTLPSDFIFSDKAFDKLTISLGGKTNVQELIPNQTISLLLNEGENIITIKAISGQDTLVSPSKIMFFKDDVQKSLPEEPASICNFTAGGRVHKYGIWPGCESNYNNCGDCLNKVAIIVEGYDPTNERSLEEDEQPCYDNSGNVYDKNLYCLANDQGMADALRDAGYDVVILDFAEGKDPIQTQAEVVKQLIRELKANLDACNSNHEFVFIGPSLAGVTIRYALADMEGSGEDHNTRLFVSFDAPHQGANLPLSIQHFIRFSKNSFPLNLAFLFEPLKNAKEVWEAIPTQQLLYYHGKYTNIFTRMANPSPFHTQFYHQLNNLNGGKGWPEKCRNVAVSNGSGNGTNQLFSPGDKLFDAGVYLALSNTQTMGWAVPNNVEQSIFAGVSKMCIPTSLFGIVCFPTNSVLVRVKNTIPLDNTPGGEGNFVGSMVSEIPNWMCLFSLGCNCSVTGNCAEQTENFIPTISSLDLQNTTNLSYNVHANITGNNGIGFKEIDYSDNVSPFDAMYLSAENEPHVINGVTPQIAQFIENEIMPSDLYLQNRTVSNSADFEGVNTVTAGRNVTNRYPQGDFVVNNSFGKVDIRAGKKVVLEPGTTLSPSGTGSVEVHIQPFSDCAAFCKMATNPDETNETGQKELIASSDPVSEHLIPAEKLPEETDTFKSSAFPNPFSDHVHIEYYLPESGDVKVSIYNFYGQEIETLEKAIKDKGTHLLTFDARKLSSGIYFGVISINGKREKSIKMQLIK